MARSPGNLLLANQVPPLIGADVTQAVQVEDGWPSRLEILAGDHVVPVTLHVAKVSPHGRGKDYERRFQNPAQRTPVVSVNGSLPLLVGVSLDPSPVLVVTDGRSRLGREARFSIVFHERILEEARQAGWGEYVSNSGEHIYAIQPRMLPVLAWMLATNTMPPIGELALAAQAAGLAENVGDDVVLAAAANRARRAALVLVRRTRFGNLVRQAYDNKCSMCGLGIGLVQGAHIKPVSAPGAPDQVWNGMALCHNHHGLFDSHRLWVDPNTYRIVKHPSLLQAAAADPVVHQFTFQIHEAITPPAAAAHQPRPQMFIERYDHFQGLYDWA